jgi:hypothetical protein
MRILAPILAMALSLPWYGTWNSNWLYGGGTYKGGTYQSIDVPKVLPLSSAKVAAIGQDIPSGTYWTPTGIDFTGEHVFYFDPDVASGGTGTWDDPFPSFGDAIAADIAANGTGVAYLTKYAANASETWDGLVHAGDVMVLKKGDHGSTTLSAYYWTEWTTVYGMQGSYFSPGSGTDQSKGYSIFMPTGKYWLFENVEWRGLRSAFGKTGTTSGSTYGYLDDYDTGPGFFFTYNNGNPGPSYIVFNGCKFSPGNSHVAWTQDQWNTLAPDGIEVDVVDHFGIFNSEFLGINYGFKSSRSSYLSADLNYVNGFMGDFIQIGVSGTSLSRNISISGNTVLNQYVTSMNHVDGIVQLYLTPTDTTTSPMRNIVISGNTYIFTTSKTRSPSHFYCYDGTGYDGTIDGDGDDWFGAAGMLLGSLNTCAIAQMTVSNNIMVGQSQGAIYMGGDCDTCLMVNNTTVATWTHADQPAYLEAGGAFETLAPSVYFNTYYSVTNDPGTYVGCVLANNATGFDNDNRTGVTKANNYFYGHNGTNVAGFTSHSLAADVGTFDLTPAAGSPLIDTASATYAPATDYNGTSRPIGMYDDIGAYESPVTGGVDASGSIVTNGLFTLTTEVYDPTHCATACVVAINFTANTKLVGTYLAAQTWSGIAWVDKNFHDAARFEITSTNATDALVIHLASTCNNNTTQVRYNVYEAATGGSPLFTSWYDPAHTITFPK